MLPSQLRAALRLLPVLFLGYILAYIDRVNVGFAKLGMKAEPWFSDAVFATGAGLFFIGYFIFEVPGNVILHRVGARLWMTRIMLTWGLVSSLLAVSSSSSSFYFLRFLLGVAEAGFFPGILLYLTEWFPQSQRSRMVAWFMTAIPAAGVIGSPVSGWLLDGATAWPSLRPWQWMFLLEGVPTVLMGLALPWLLPNNPETASWLNWDQKKELREALEREQIVSTHAPKSVAGVFRSQRVWLLALNYFLIIIGLYGVTFWLPQILSDRLTIDGVKPSAWTVGLASIVPWGFAACGMLWIARHADRNQTHRRNLGLASIIGGIALAGSAQLSLPTWALLLLLGIACAGVMGSLACFWALPTQFLSGLVAAAGIAWINSLGNLAGYISPEMVGYLKAHHGMDMALYAVATSLVMAGVMANARCCGTAASDVIH